MVRQAVLGMLARLAPWRLTDHEIRAEAWALGARHQGEVLAGARSEVRARDLPVRRAILLRAVIRAYSADRSTTTTAAGDD